jgi:hypothetical protein
MRLSERRTAVRVLFILAGVTWLLGGNILVALHRRRTSERPSSSSSFFGCSFFAFNRREWLAFIAIAVLTFPFLGIAVTYSSH